MINLYKQDGETLYGIKEFILDTSADVSKLPTYSKKVGIGSTAMVISTGEIYILNGERQWVSLKVFASNGTEGSTNGDNGGTLLEF